MAGVKGKSGRKANELIIRQNLIIALDEVDPASGRKRMMNIIQKLVEAAEDGKQDAINCIFDRLEGKPKQVSEVSGPDGGEIPVGINISFK